MPAVVRVAAMTEEFKQAIDKFVAENKIVLFMKGTKQFPQCGFSNTTVQILNTFQVPYETVRLRTKHTTLRADDRTAEAGCHLVWLLAVLLGGLGLTPYEALCAIQYTFGESWVNRRVYTLYGCAGAGLRGGMCSPEWCECVPPSPPRGVAGRLGPH
jgi:glutaredoxin-related protein